MKYNKQLFLSLLLFLPMLVFAHGEEVLFTFFIPIIPGVIFLLVLNALYLKVKSKMILLVIYVASVFLSFYVTNKWPYRDNESTINLIFAFGPPLVAFAAYFIIRRWEKDLTRKEIKSFLENDLGKLEE